MNEKIFEANNFISTKEDTNENIKDSNWHLENLIIFLSDKILTEEKEEVAPKEEQMKKLEQQIENAYVEFLDEYDKWKSLERETEKIERIMTITD